LVLAMSRRAKPKLRSWGSALPVCWWAGLHGVGDVPLPAPRQHTTSGHGTTTGKPGPSRPGSPYRSGMNSFQAPRLVRSAGRSSTRSRSCGWRRTTFWPVPARSSGRMVGTIAVSNGLPSW